MKQDERMTVIDRSEHLLKNTNTSIEDRALNRRTEIIIMLKLDEFFQLLEAKNES